jgi:hypothetical protein
MISWLTVPAVLRQNERVQSDGSLRRCENSCRQSVRAAPRDELGNVRRQRVRIGPDEQVDMMGLDRQRDDLPIVFMCHLVNDLLQTVMYWPEKHPPTPPGTPDDVVHDKAYTLLLVVVLHVAITSFFNRVCKSERPFIPRLQTGGYL